MSQFCHRYVQNRQIAALFRFMEESMSSISTSLATVVNMNPHPLKSSPKIMKEPAEARMLAHCLCIELELVQY
jgi:hypothetical protein